MSRRLQILYPVILLLICPVGRGLTAELRSVEERLAEQQTRLGYYIEQQVQAWNVGKDGARDELKYFTEYKITSERGWESVLPVVIYHDWRTEIDDIEIVITQGGKKPRKFGRKDMLDVPAYAGFELYSDMRVLAFQERVSDERGSLTVSFTQRQTQPILTRIFYVQQQVQVHNSSITVTVPDGWQINHIWRERQEDGERGSAGGVFQWQGTDLAPLLEEPYAPPAPELVRRLMIACVPPGSSGPDILSFASWNDVGGWFRSLYTTQVSSNDEIDRTVEELTAGVDSRLEKIRRIYDYVQSKIRYVAIEVGIGGFQPHSAHETFANKYGDCKDKATLLNAMLEKCGIDGYPVLVRIAQAGSVEPDFPSPYQFNHCIVFVPASQYLPAAGADSSAGEVPAELLGGLFLDATPGRCPFGELPMADQSTWALVVDDTSSRLARVPDTWVQPNLISRKTRVQLRANGSAVCSVTECSYGIENQSLRMKFFGKKEADRQGIWSRKLNSQFPRQSYLELTIANEDSIELPIELQSRFTVPKYSQRSGAMLILPASYWKVFDENPLKELIRVNDLVFGYRRSVVDTLLLELPDGYTVQNLPEPAGMVQPPGEFSLTCSQPSPGVVRIVRWCTISDTRVPASDFSGVREFIDELDAAESAKLVLSRSY